MSKYIAVITRADITRAALVEAGGRSMEQVKAACGCQYILNSWFYDTITGRPVGNLKIDGTVKAAAGWNGWGLTWDKGPTSAWISYPTTVGRPTSAAWSC